MVRSHYYVHTYSTYHPDSFWERYNIHWCDENLTDDISPWEMESYSTEGTYWFLHSMQNLQVMYFLHTDTSSSKLLAAATESSLPGDEKDKIMKCLKDIMKRKEAEMFQKPVDAKEHPAYYETVAFPTDLTTISEKLKGNFYR